MSLKRTTVIFPKGGEEHTEETLRIALEGAKERKIEIGIIATPPEAAQNVVDLLVEAEVRGILNFAPTRVVVPEGFVVKDVFFTTVLDNLAYLLSNM